MNGLQNLIGGSSWEEYLLAFSSTTVLECHTTILDTIGPSDQLVLD